MEKYFEKFGSNFIVAAFVPSLTFITISVILFFPLVPPKTAEWFQIPALVQNFTVLGIVIMLLGILLSFTLSSLNTFILKLMEGYVLFEHFPFLFEREKRKARKLRKQIEHAKVEANRLEKRINSVNSANVQNRYMMLLLRTNSRQIGLSTSYQQKFPLETSEILPTPFGNILKSAEYYSADRYNIDSVSLWPRMIHVIDKDYMELIDESRNELSFLVNCSVLCLVFGLISLPITIYLAFIRNDQLYVYLAADIVAVAAAYIFHRASLFSVGQYGDMIRSAYDLFRKRLFKALGFATPNDLETEKGRWAAICEFLNAGEDIHPMTLGYEAPAHENDPKLVIPVERVSQNRHSRKAR